MTIIRYYVGIHLLLIVVMRHRTPWLSRYLILFLPYSPLSLSPFVSPLSSPPQLSTITARLKVYGLWSSMPVATPLAWPDSV